MGSPDPSIVPRKSVFGSCIIMRHVATGGMGSVWEGWLNPYAELCESMLNGQSRQLRRLAGVKSDGDGLSDEDVKKIRDWAQKRTAEFLESRDLERRISEEYTQMLEYVSPRRRIANDFRRAIKVLNPQLGLNTKVVQRFLKEIDILAQTLDHPCVIKVVESGQAGGRYFAVMEFVDSINLEEEPLSVRDALRITRHALEGLIHAHEKGILHRDMKPANILVSRDFKKIKLTDFGLAKAIDESVGGKLTSTGIIMGTPNYLDPERARAEPVVKESDVFSLGATCYKLLTGTPPAQGTSPMETMGMIGHDKDFAWPRSLKPQISEELEDVVMMMLSKDLRRRLTTYEVRALLETIEKRNRFLHQRPDEEQERTLAARQNEARRRVRKLRRAAARRGRPDRFVAAGEFYDAVVELAELQPRDRAESVSARADLYAEAIQFHRDVLTAAGPPAPPAVDARARLLEKRLALERRRLEQKGFTYVPPRRSRPWLRAVVALLLAAALGGAALFGVQEWARRRNEAASEEASRGLASVEQSLGRREHVRASQEIEAVQAALGRMRRPHTPEFARSVDVLRARVEAHREAIGRYRTDIQVYHGLMAARRIAEDEYARIKAALAAGNPPRRKAVEALQEQVAHLLARLREPNVVNPEAIGPELQETLRQVESLAASLAELRTRAKTD